MGRIVQDSLLLLCAVAAESSWSSNRAFQVVQVIGPDLRLVLGEREVTVTTCRDIQEGFKSSRLHQEDPDDKDMSTRIQKLKDFPLFYWVCIS